MEPGDREDMHEAGPGIALADLRVGHPCAAPVHHHRIHRPGPGAKRRRMATASQVRTRRPPGLPRSPFGGSPRPAEARQARWKPFSPRRNQRALPEAPNRGRVRPAGHLALTSPVHPATRGLTRASLASGSPGPTSRLQLERPRGGAPHNMLVSREGQRSTQQPRHCRDRQGSAPPPPVDGTAPQEYRGDESRLLEIRERPVARPAPKPRRSQWCRSGRHPPASPLAARRQFDLAEPFQHRHLDRGSLLIPFEIDPGDDRPSRASTTYLGGSRLSA